MERLLSSRLTFFYKRIFPAAWIIAFSAVTLLLWIGNCGGTTELKWVALICLIGGTIFLRWFSVRLKVVSVQGDHLLVSDYLSEEQIPLQQIEEVKETRLCNPKLIKLRLLRPGQWGNEIVFIAPLRLQFVFWNHPLARELRDMIREKRKGSSGYISEREE